MTSVVLCMLVILMTERTLVRESLKVTTLTASSGAKCNNEEKKQNDAPIGLERDVNVRTIQTSKKLERFGLGSGRLLLEENLKNISEANESNCENRRFLIYKCDSSHLCGGWGDRQKGIISTFLLALLTKRIFVIYLIQPCELHNFLLPNVYNWNTCRTYLGNVTKKDVTEINYIDSGGNDLDKIQNYDFDLHWKSQVIVVRSNVYMIERIQSHKRVESQMKWLRLMSREETVHLVLHTLFRPRQCLIDDVLNFHKTYIKEKTLVCSHIRIGQNPSIPNDVNMKGRTPNVNVIFEFLKMYDNKNNSVIYIATDSDEVRKQAKIVFASYININRQIVHVDRLGKLKTSPSKACEGFYTALLEQFILSQCETLVLSHSGFGIIAAYIRGSSENLFLYSHETDNILMVDLKHIKRVFKYD